MTNRSDLVKMASTAEFSLAWHVQSAELAKACVRRIKDYQEPDMKTYCANRARDLGAASRNDLQRYLEAKRKEECR